MAIRSKAEEFRERAAECERKAAEAHDLGAREAFKNAAWHWWMMAEQAERLGR
jgi:hypothetical protein